jgi:TonB family protein
VILWQKWRSSPYGLHPRFNDFGTLPKVTTLSKLKTHTGMDEMRIRVFLITVALMALTTSLAAAQSSAPPASERRIASRVAATYPELAKKMHIHGVVRVEAVVRPNGSVKSTRALGGNPVLVDAALDAVGKWKFESGQNETTEVVQLVFESQ